MGRPYSLDLRERVVAAVAQGGMSRRRAAAQFGVGVSTAIAWMRRLRETGAVRPGKMGGHRPKAIAGEHRVWLLERAKEGDFTLRGLVAELAGRGLKVDYRTMWNFVHAEGLSFKKNRRRQRTRSSRRRAQARPVEQISGPYRG
jgi:transposase